jgi:hypothetical protein
MNTTINATVKMCRSVLFFFALLFIVNQVSAQSKAMPELGKMPEALETDLALSALPPYVRAHATIYLLDPAKGYYVSRKGTNGFICFVMRTAWEWAEYRNDIFAAISYDAEGAKAIFPVYMAEAAMRASGKYTALQARNIIIDRFKKGIYKAPAKGGVSYMLAPVMRTYTANPNTFNVMTMHMPHYMFYAPNLTNTDIGNSRDGSEDGPIVANPEAMFLGERNAPDAYIIVGTGETKRAKIVAENASLLKRLENYSPYFKLEMKMEH